VSNRRQAREWAQHADYELENYHENKKTKHLVLAAYALGKATALLPYGSKQLATKLEAMKQEILKASGAR
jgi:hypothetical protein